MEDRAELLAAFLNIFWLRPENAFMVARRSLVLQEHPFTEPLMDISCGDGLFTFTHLGGRLSPEFDMFVDVGSLERVRSENADMFDSYDARLYLPIVTDLPSGKVAFGTDWKQTLLNKAFRLNLYHNLLLHDNNTRMPFRDKSFMTVYSNSAYWIDNLEAHLRDMWRILHSDGRVLLQIKVDKIKDYRLGHYAPFLGDKLAGIIDRGRLATWRGLKPVEWWVDNLPDMGFEIVECRGFIGKIHAYVWDIGLRPLAPVMVRMANSLSRQDRRAVKEEWIHYCMDLLMPLVNLEPASDGECTEFMFVLAKVE